MRRFVTFLGAFAFLVWLPSCGDYHDPLEPEITIEPVELFSLQVESTPTPVDLNDWTAESYPAVANFDPGVWTVNGGGFTVLQSVNGQPTLFYSNFDVFNTEVEGAITVVTTGDDDYVGFALGYQPGDVTNPSADYLLIDWKQADQGYDFGSPSCTPGSNGYAGLAVSRVTGIPTADEFWGHWNSADACDGSGVNSGLVELARGATLSSTGWSDNTQYSFKFEYSATTLKVYVDGSLEIDIAGTFPNGRIAFYNFSQAQVEYNGYVVVIVNVGIDIKPGSYPNCFNNDGHGVIPVAILGSETFDVGLVDPGTVNLDGLNVGVRGKSSKLLAHIEDVNSDGFDDLVVQIEDVDGVFAQGTGTATVAGDLIDGRHFEGSDEICITQ